MAKRIVLVGASGRMGQSVIAKVRDSSDFTISAEISEGGTFSGEGDVIIDFSNPSVTKDLLTFATDKRMPAVIATTGHGPEEKSLIVDASLQIPIFLSANMSVGIALLSKLVNEAVGVMPEADIEIVETHHNRKLDAPSGTALLLADGIRKVKESTTYCYGRSGKQAREKDEIGFHSIRSGNIVGEHRVILGTDTQTITVSHTAHDRTLFAEGALAAAKFLLTKEAGLYGMEDLIDES